MKNPVPYGNKDRKYRRISQTNLPQIKSNNQSSNNVTLPDCIAEKRLTDSLELLDNVGYSNDSAIRRIQYFQWEGL
ncbi:MAG: hypothetical protein HC836_42450 [Richelia sp. RM2_1_2]|nr:hypothetical protein [Richelia sp. SM2_1_7]NJM21754.1 hypothetical protein [Richelia sp. SM1_7_0]NJN12350.1 hypothetical protein [Richelia sp. RM1_1_1]NJO30686.1 hypothetical protein [Richelia sp. SL_2_1]NJO64570.1 hypothetical protein [Richelia sp. RM2_1_2]